MTPFDLIKPYFVAHRKRIAVGILCLIAVDFLQLYIPRIIKRAIDDLTALDISQAALLRYAGWILALAVTIGGFRYIWRRCLIGTSRIIEEGLRNRLFSHIQTLPPAYFDRVKTGDLMAHATNDINHIRMATGMGMVALTDAVVLGTAAIGFMAYINVKLTLYVMIPMPLIIFGTRFFSRKMHRRYGEVQAAFAELTESVRERFSGIRVIKAYTREQAAETGLDQVSAAYIRKNLKLVRITGMFFPLMVFFSNVSLVLVLLIGGRQTITATITPGDFAAFISYLGLITWPMMATGWVTNLIQRGKASLERIHRILELSPGDFLPVSPEAKAAVFGDIVFESVLFRFPGHGTPAVGEITLTIPAGTTLGIVGPPGSGKSALAGLIPRFYDVSGGRILIGGTDIRDLPLDQLRAMVSLHPQEPFIFAGSVRENILFFTPAPDRHRLKEAVQKAQLAGTIDRMPDGENTVVGEKGIILSGGQKQRVALARALIHPAPIMVLDDPISQVDMETGRAITDTLRDMAGDRTLIIISHRLSAVRFADRIITLENGRIVESGTHDQLLARNGYYARTFRLQELAEARHAD